MGDASQFLDRDTNDLDANGIPRTLVFDLKLELKDSHRCVEGGKEVVKVDYSIRLNTPGGRGLGLRVSFDAADPGINDISQIREAIERLLFEDIDEQQHHSSEGKVLQ